jgi:glucose-1-phosphate thymidylyltransferase
MVCSPESLEPVSKLWEDGSSLGVEISYVTQESPKGVAESLIIGGDFISKHSFFDLILGDNLFHGPGIHQDVSDEEGFSGARIVACQVSNPRDYGVVEMDSSGKAISIEEKPKQPKSPLAVTGLYTYDMRATDIAKSLYPSPRGEIEITDVNKAYLELGELKVQVLSRQTVWADAGTFDGLADATQYVRTVEKRQGFKIGCPEEVAWRMGYIDDNQLAKLAEPLMKSGYGHYLIRLLEQEK